MKNIAIILASGTGARSGALLPKQFIKISSKTILEMSCDAFQKNDFIDEIIVVVHSNFINLAKSIIFDGNYTKVKKIITGGDTRKESSYKGIQAIEEQEANVLIHDCVRPFLSQDIINSIIKSLKKYNAVNVAIPITDTIFECKNQIIQNIPKRETLMSSQTPQSFKLSLIKKAHELALKNGDEEFTDDCGLVQKYNLAPINIIDGDRRNIKITYPLDFEIAKILEKDFT